VSSIGYHTGPSMLPWLLLLLTGCSSPEQRIAAAAREAHSWEATIRKTSHELEAGSVPRGYAKQILRLARAAEQEQAQRPEWRAVSPETRRSLTKAIAELASSLGQWGESLRTVP
jgi:hypothetical protein